MNLDGAEKQVYRRKQDEETTYWLSYSDMMAGLLLTFVLIISLTVLHSKIQYDQKQTELLGKEQELLVQSDALKNEQALAATQQEKLLAQEERLLAQQDRLSAQEEELNAQSIRLSEQEDTLTRQSELLTELQSIMDSQQDKLDRIIGIRTELIESLKAEFEGSNLAIAVDPQTGAITMDSNIFFEFNQVELKDSGKEFLSAFLPRYVKILLGQEYREYVSEIDIVGHTDNVGTYLFNLDLSQKRAYSVAEYCLNEQNGLLDQTMLELLRGVVSTSGRSYSSPILKADGSVDMDASRRVEFLFHLKDEEMIREMIEILNGQSQNDSTSQGNANQANTSSSQASPESNNGSAPQAAAPAQSQGPGTQNERNQSQGSSAQNEGTSAAPANAPAGAAGSGDNSSPGNGDAGTDGTGDLIPPLQAGG